MQRQNKYGKSVREKQNNLKKINKILIESLRGCGCQFWVEMAPAQNPNCRMRFYQPGSGLSQALPLVSHKRCRSMLSPASPSLIHPFFNNSEPVKRTLRRKSFNAAVCRTAWRTPTATALCDLRNEFIAWIQLTFSA